MFKKTKSKSQHSQSITFSIILFSKNSSLCSIRSLDLPRLLFPTPPQPTPPPSIHRSDLEESCRGPKKQEITVVARDPVTQTSTAQVRPAEWPPPP